MLRSPFKLCLCEFMNTPSRIGVLEYPEVKTPIFQHNLISTDVNNGHSKQSTSKQNPLRFESVLSTIEVKLENTISLPILSSSTSSSSFTITSITSHLIIVKSLSWTRLVAVEEQNRYMRLSQDSIDRLWSTGNLTTICGGKRYNSLLHPCTFRRVRLCKDQAGSWHRPIPTKADEGGFEFCRPENKIVRSGGLPQSIDQKM